MIRVENLTKKFAGITAVDDISFKVDEGCIFGFLGPNGAGKTTTIRMLATLIKPTEGSIFVNGRTPSKDGEYIRSIIGILTETPGMYEKISACANLDYFSSFYGIEEIRRKQNIEKFLKLFGLWDRRNDLVSTYSKGMKQKLALARALIHEPKILFLDEPTAALDPESAFMVRSFIEQLKNDKTTVFLCTHNLEEASSLSDVVCIIKNRIIKIATLEELQKNKKGSNTEVIMAQDASLFEQVVKDTGLASNIAVENNRLAFSIESPEKSNPLIIKKLVNSGAEIIYINELKASLEEIYLDLIKS
ncbi:MAG: Daunorubicin/doxorubicin resistance ATP-binding protein DrrA [Actinobacteria bacterium ADurb.Bin346]|nr:MAG: Daunorubicin/doxorubicin resistance ATP-binding protein DrrA [Actinobacteria bacterium ADurb.Bin346]